MFLLQIFWFEKNQPVDSKGNNIKQDQEDGDQLAEEALSLVLNILPKACNALGKANLLIDIWKTFRNEKSEHLLIINGLFEFS